MTTTIKIPRAHKKRLKGFNSVSEINPWASDVDVAINDIIGSLQGTQRAIRDLTRSTGRSSVGLHAGTHRPGTGSDPLPTAAPLSILGGTSSNSIGVGDSFARNDHSHDVGTAAPAFVLGTTASEGSSNNLARVDAGIAIFDATAPADLGNAAATGSAAFAARRDHVHRSYAVRKNSTGSDFVRKRLNLIEGTNVTLTVADDAGNDEVDVTIDAAGAGGAPTDAEYVVAVAHAGLSAERVATDTATIDVDMGTAGEAKWNVIQAGLTLNNLGGTLSISKGGTGQTTATAGFDALAPTATKGDLIGHTGAASAALAVGVNRQILFADSAETTGLRWGDPSFFDNVFELVDNLDNTRIAQFGCGGITTGNTRVYTCPDDNGTLVLLKGQLGGTGALPDVRGLRETGGPTLLTVGAIVDGEFLKRVGATVVSAAAGGGDNITVNGVAVVDADFDDATPAAPAGSVNVLWQKDASSPANVSAYLDGATALGNNARVTVRKNTGADVGTRRRVNLIEGSNVTLTVADDAGSEEVDVTIAAASGSGNFGTTTVDFGAFPGKSDASVAVTGQAGIVAGSKVNAWLRLVDSADHLADEHWVESLRVFAGSIVAGTGFTIYARNDNPINEPLFPGNAAPTVSVAAAAITTEDLGEPGQSPLAGVGGIGTLIYGVWNVQWQWA